MIVLQTALIHLLQGKISFTVLRGQLPSIFRPLLRTLVGYYQNTSQNFIFKVVVVCEEEELRTRRRRFIFRKTHHCLVQFKINIYFTFYQFNASYVIFSLLLKKVCCVLRIPLVIGKVDSAGGRVFVVTSFHVGFKNSFYYKLQEVLVN